MTNTIPNTTLVSATCMGNSVVGCHVISMKMIIRVSERDWSVMPGERGKTGEMLIN